MRIFVTGGSGFIGSNFVIDQITAHNNQILNLDKLTYAGNPDNLLSVEKDKNYTFVEGDIKSSKVVSNIFESFSPEVVVNFAAESHVDRSIDNPMEFVNTNVIGTVNLLMESTKYYKSIKSEISDFKFVHISTDEVFGSLGNEGFFTEATSYDPSSPYSASKASSDHFVRSWHRTFDLPTIITNCSNNYGPFQFTEKLIPLIIMNCINEKALPVYGDGENVRDWLYVLDHCQAINSVLLDGEIGETYNIGGDNEIKNIDIVKTICKIMDELQPRNEGKLYSDLISFVDDRPGHDFRYAIDASKIKHELNWEPKENFSTGIRKTVEWYLNNQNWCIKLNNKYNQNRLGKLS